MHVLIVGGGIAGPVLGVALRTVGIKSTVYEARHHHEGGAGAFLQLAPNGMNALAAVGLGGVPARAGGFPTSGITFSNRRGRPVGELNSTDESDRYGVANNLLKRDRLHTELIGAARAAAVPVVFGKRLSCYRKTAHGVEATFADGSAASGDVLVGADGTWSRTRRQLLGDEPAPAYTGMVNIGGFAQADLHEVETARNQMVFGHRAFFGYTAAPNGEVYWFSNVPVPQQVPEAIAGATPREWLHRVRRLHAGDPAPVGRILDAAPPPVGVWPICAIQTLPRWHDDRICLLGDAAHAMSPSAGQGAAIAIEDAVVLASCLRDAPDPAAAFVRYQGLRKDRAEAVVKQARRNSNHKIPGPIGGATRDLLLPLFLKLGAKQAASTYSHAVSLDDDAAPVGARHA